MKTLKCLTILCIILSCSVKAVNAQEEEQGTVSFFQPVEVVLELWCEGVYVDFIHDVYVEAHARVHYDNGDVTWMKATVHGNFLFNGVTYEINGKTTLIAEDIQEAHYELKGDDGSHYVGILTADDNLHTFTFSKALCPGN